MSLRDEIPRTINPRRPSASFLPLIVVDQNTHSILLERTGEIHPLSDLQLILLREPSSYWIVCNMSGLLAHMNDLMALCDTWQFRGSPIKRDIYNSAGPSGRIKTSNFCVAFFGFQSHDKKKKGKYHYPIDPTIFLRRYTDTIGGNDIHALMRWGKDVREWCEANELKPKPTAGGIAGQLLKDPRFYPVARRKVPGATNARARQTLPGNHYRLYASESKIYKSAVYLDLSSAHHNAALKLDFPDSDALYARGHFRVTDATMAQARPHKAWCRPGGKLYANLITRAHGLLLAHITAPRMSKGTFPLPHLEKPGTSLQWIYTNEIQDLLESGGIIDGIEAAWVSFKTDSGLNKYAAWALTETATATDYRKQWLKPVLLATYGLLAARPRIQEFAYGKAMGGELKNYPAGGGIVTAWSKCTTKENEMPVTNVIHRGMIEAETRLEILRLARYLHKSGVNVLSVYADSVIAENNVQLPLIPHPWRSKGELTRLRFFNATSFTSVEMTKLPGIPLEALARTRRIADLHRARETARFIGRSQKRPETDREEAHHVRSDRHSHCDVPHGPGAVPDGP